MIIKCLYLLNKKEPKCIILYREFRVTHKMCLIYQIFKSLVNLCSPCSSQCRICVKVHPMSACGHPAEEQKKSLHLSSPQKMY